MVRGGGVAGLVTRTELAAADLAPADAAALRERVAASGLLETSEPAPRPSAPDELHYELTVAGDGHRHTVRLGERDLTPGVRDLVEWADAHPAATKRVERASRG